MVHHTNPARAVALAFAALLPASGRAEPPPLPRIVTLRSPRPSGDPTVDRIWFTYRAPPLRSPRPAVVLLHPLGEMRNRLMERFAEYLSERDMVVANLVLPYHMQRLPARDYPLRHFATTNVDDAVQAYGQAADDVSAVVTWLGRQPDVDPKRIGIVGVSLGAIIAHLAMGLDGRLTAGVAILGGGNLPDLYRRSLLYRLAYPWGARRLGPSDLERIRSIDPLTYVQRNRPRRVLMIEAARDDLVLPSDARVLWKALGRPPIRWLDTNHYAPSLGAGSIMKASAAYLNGVWSGWTDGSERLPGIWAPTLKVGLVAGLDRSVEPAVTWQVVSLGRRRDQMSLLHGDVGWGGGGLFAAAGITVNAHVDAGIGYQFGARRWRPYLALHMAL